MDTGGRPDYGVCAAVDVHYLRTGGARAAAVLAADASFAHVLPNAPRSYPGYRPTGRGVLPARAPAAARGPGRPERAGPAGGRRLRRPGPGRPARFPPLPTRCRSCADPRRARCSAPSRALGATPQQVTTGLSAAQLLPALPGAILGIPLAIGMDAAVSSGQPLPIPPAWQLLAVALVTLLVMAGLTAIPARIAARRPAAEILQSELA